MLNYLTIMIIALAATMLAMPLAHILGRRLGAWDTPDELSHTTHRFKLVRTGGIAMAAGFYVGILAIMLFDQGLLNNRNMGSVMIGGAAVFVIGLLDDLHEIRPWLKAVLLLTACLVTALIMPAVDLSGFERLDFILVLLILMGGANAFNLMDGLDGLAAGLAIAAGLGLLALSLQLNTLEGGSVKMAYIGVALGFLFFNRPPAKIFMGDCGSLLMGFLLASMGLNVVKSSRAGIIPVLLVLSPFVLDTGLAIVRRFLGGRDVFTGDRRHVYDLLHAKLPRVSQVDWAMWSLGLAFSALGWAAVFLDPWMQTALLAGSWLAFSLAMIRLGMFAPPEPPEPAAPRSILVVDDDPGITQIIESFLVKSGKGYDVRTAADGFAAGQELIRNKPDLVVLDIVLPGLDGFGVCRQIKALDKSIKVVAISGNDTEKNRRRMKEAGAEAFLAKPFKMKELLEIMEELLDRGTGIS